jgi:hypothetical protein
LDLYGAFMRVGMRMSALREVTCGHSYTQVANAVLRARSLVCDVIGLGEHIHLWRRYTSILMVDWFEVCVATECIPVLPIPLHMRDRVAEAFRKRIDEVRAHYFRPASRERIDDALAQAERVCLVQLRGMSPLPDQPSPSLTAQDFINAMMDMPRAEREAFAARLLARP